MQHLRNCLQIKFQNDIIASEKSRTHGINTFFISRYMLFGLGGYATTPVAPFLSGALGSQKLDNYL